jgi:hypothetical protein
MDDFIEVSPSGVAPTHISQSNYQTSGNRDADDRPATELVFVPDAELTTHLSIWSGVAKANGCR